jgi:hypothetical protein
LLHFRSLWEGRTNSTLIWKQRQFGNSFVDLSIFSLLDVFIYFFSYVYQPLDSLYLLLITNRASNIVEDLDTLRLLSKGIYSMIANVFCNDFVVVPNITGTTGNLSEERVTEKCFDLIFAFDEVFFR